MSPVRALIVFALAICIASRTAQAQTPAAPQPQPKAQSRPATPPTPTLTAPYDHDLQRLSEILGALHFLRAICGSNEGQKWREEAQALIDACVETLGLRSDRLLVEFTQHTGDEMYRYGRGWAPDWTPDEARPAA